MKNGIIIFYSYTGNTRSIAKKLAKSLKYDLLELNPKVPYTNDYELLVKEEKNKIDKNEIINIKDINLDFSIYDSVIFGTPVWWYTMSPVIRTFLNNYDLSDKKVDVFVTNGGWLGHTINDFKNYVNVNSYISIKFDNDILDLEENKLDEWISNLK